MNTEKRLYVSPSPHIRSEMTTQKIMLNVLIALLPAVAASIYFFGFRALMVIFTCAASAAAFEYFCRIIMKREQTVSDLSAVVTGVILALNLPVTIPLWIAMIGSFIAIVIAKQLFGGLGQNFANPAIVARIVLMLSFTSHMTQWAVPFYYKAADVVTGATPLVSGLGASAKQTYIDLFLGNCGGCLGETSALALLIGGVYLCARKIISPAAPLGFIGTVAFCTLVSGGDVLFSILSGGLMLGAIFMATDYVTTPVSNKGRLIFGIGCGLITFIIRTFGTYPEGVSFSILLMNILTPYIDNLTRPKPLGAKVPAKKAKEGA